MELFLKLIYNRYARPGKTWIRRIHLRILGYSHLARMLFGVSVTPICGEKNYYFDLTTFLLKGVIVKRLRELSDPKLLEIGVGKYAILSGYLSRFVDRTIDAVDVDSESVETSRQHVQANSLNVNVFQSNLFLEVPRQYYDVIVWNLPYYQQPEYLYSLFQSAPQYMDDHTKLIIGYNTKPLSRSTVLDILSNYSDLRLEKVLTYKWNLHDVIVIGKHHRK